MDQEQEDYNKEGEEVYDEGGNEPAVGPPVELIRGGVLSLGDYQRINHAEDSRQGEHVDQDLDQLDVGSLRDLFVDGGDEGDEGKGQG